MLTRASKCPTRIIQEAADTICSQERFLKENLPRCNNSAEVSKTLASSDTWHVLANDGFTAVFKLDISERTAVVSQICASDNSPAALTEGLRRELRSMKIPSLTVRVPTSEVELWTANGFQRGLACVKFSRVPVESNMMPLLPLTNATQKDLTILSQLMYTSYVKMDGGFPDTQSAETMLRAIMSGVNGQYLQDASFASGASPNLVSACLLTLDTPDEAKIQQLFTHPLYRARGLATTEIAAAMNRLSGSGIRSLTAWSREDNGVVTRLLTKLGFGQERTAVEMLAST